MNTDSNSNNLFYRLKSLILFCTIMTKNLQQQLLLLHSKGAISKSWYLVYIPNSKSDYFFKEAMLMS